jgi:hypothetical protein
VNRKLLSCFLASFFLVGFALFAQDASDTAIEPTAVDAPAVTDAPVVSDAAVSADDTATPSAPVSSDKPLAANTVTVSGTISEIATDGSYLIINDGTNPVKFSTSKDFIDEAYMEVGDKVKTTGEKTADGLKLLDYDYIFDDAYDPASGAIEDTENAPTAESVIADTAAPANTDATAIDATGVSDAATDNATENATGDEPAAE